MIEKIKKSDISKKSKYKFSLYYLTLKNLKTMFRDRPQLIWLIGYPLLLIIVFSLAFGYTQSRSPYDVIIFNKDPDVQPEFYSNILIYTVETDLQEYMRIQGTEKNYTIDNAEEELKYENIDAIIEIPSDFSESINGNKEPIVNIKTVPDEVTAGVISSIIKQIVDHMIIISKGGNPSKVTVDRYENTIKLTTFDYLAPGFVIAGVTVCISQITLHFAEEKEKGTLKRLGTTPVARKDILLSGMLSELVVVSFQIVVLLILLYIFGAYFAASVNLIILFLIPMLFAFTCLGFGLLLTSFVKSETSAGGLSWFLILPLQFLGGLFFSFNNPIIYFIPTYYAAHAMRLVMVGGLTSWDAIGFDILILSGFGIITTLLGIFLFQRKTAIL